MNKERKDQFYPEIIRYIYSGILEFGKIPEDRKRILNSFSSYVRESKPPINLIFICTHNSRRSHLSQIWARVAADYYGLDGIKTYSGGTKATAFNIRAVNFMRKAGFVIEGNDSENPHYKVSYSDSYPTMDAFSKTFDDLVNPQKDFAAIMTCSHAEEACPVVPGANMRISLHYDDPKDFDDTDQEEEKYAERSRQIAREMFYVMSKK